MTRQRGTLVASALAMFCIQLDFFPLTLALPDMAWSFAVTAESAQRTLSGYMLSLGSVFIVAGRAARLEPHFRPTLVVAGAVTIAGPGLILLTVVTTWWAYVPVFAICGFGLGLGWTFTNIPTGSARTTRLCCASRCSPRRPRWPGRRSGICLFAGA